MAEVSDLTTAQLETLVAYDFATLSVRLNNVLARVHDANDAEITETKFVRDALLALNDIILASGNTAAVTAYDILHP